MTALLDHTIVWANDREREAAFLAEMLGFAPATPSGPFLVIPTGNRISLDVAASEEKIAPQHYAFKVTDAEFDEVFERITERGLDYWADPMHRNPGEITQLDGGRGLYFDSPAGHALEILTQSNGA